MTKALKYLGSGRSMDPILNVAAAITAVAGINEHVVDDEEIRQALALEGSEPSADNVDLVRENIVQGRS